ncbi:MAG: mandelate racemase/muconate lactonizing enzyme family protein [Firmicutes bacterium]|nr:mandelate racemase/muconate lactonizing enzyme family protein [Bacillota bacterium]
MKVERIELYHISIPLPEDFYPSWIPGYPQRFNRSTLIKITTDDGLVGYSAGMAMEEEREGLGTLLGQYLIGQDVEKMEEVRHLLREASYLGWRNSWIEAAFWDLLGKKENKPLYKLLGGKEGRLQAYCSTGEVHEPARRAEEVLAAREMGFKVVKLRVHDHDPQKDIEQIRVVREAVGDSMILGVDANQGWPVTIIEKPPIWDLERALEFARACEEYDMAWLEEPLDMYAFDEMAALRRQTKTAIAGGELTPGWHEHKILFEKESLDIYQPDSTFSGVDTAVKVMQEALGRGLEFSPHTWTNGIGLAINLQVAAACPKKKAVEFPYEPPAWIPQYRDGIMTEHFNIDKEGYITLPDKPGLGFEIDEKALSRYGRKFFDMTPRGLAVKTIRQRGLFSALKLAKKKKQG